MQNTRKDTIASKVKISVVTVSYNSSKTIADTINSVNNQTYRNFEHLIIDGVSKDETVKIIRSLNYPNLVLNSEPDSGIYDAMNKGLIRATGDVVGFLNSDDFYADNDVLGKIAKVFEDPSVDACFGDLVYITEDNLNIVRYWKSRPFKAGSFGKAWSPAHPTFYIRRSLIDKLGLFDLNYKLAADAEFMMRYLENGRLHSSYIPSVLVRMRIGGVSNQSWKNIKIQNLEIFHALRKNNIEFSKATFVFNKLAARFVQRLVGFFQ